MEKKIDAIVGTMMLCGILFFVGLAIWATFDNSRVANICYKKGYEDYVIAGEGYCFNENKPKISIREFDG